MNDRRLFLRAGAFAATSLLAPSLFSSAANAVTFSRIWVHGSSAKVQINDGQTLSDTSQGFDVVRRDGYLRMEKRGSDTELGIRTSYYPSTPVQIVGENLQLTSIIFVYRRNSAVITFGPVRIFDGFREISVISGLEQQVDDECCGRWNTVNIGVESKISLSYGLSVSFEFLFREGTLGKAIEISSLGCTFDHI